MSNQNGKLNMVQTYFSIRSLMQLARLNKLPIHFLDLGYIVHCKLRKLFGDLAPAPFRLMEDRHDHAKLRILGYSMATVEQLIEHANQFALPEAFQGFDPDTTMHKPMPETWKPGQLFSFEVLVCPIRRIKKQDPDNPDHKISVEIDAFLAECINQGGFGKKYVDRQKVYNQWLKEQFQTIRGATLIKSRLYGFRRMRHIRLTKEKNRKAKTIERPCALMVGQLKIQEPNQFNKMIKRGIGRHRAFGYGMLLLKPWDETLC